MSTTLAVALASFSHTAWRNRWEGLIATGDTDADAISDALEACRSAVVSELRALH